MLRGAVALSIVGLAMWPVASQDVTPPPVRAGTPTAIDLTAPPDRDSFSFVLFGDRTTGPRHGLGVLAQAVQMTNRLDPDFVMTIGDLIEGSGNGDRWQAQAREYQEIVAELAAPWYPCAGNHDVYGSGDNPARFRETFGPLYYSFDFRWAHFVVLFTDEGLSKHDQNMSTEQIAWLAEDLASTSAQQVFVFMHQPRWHYQNSNWPDVHQVLVDDGRVQAIFAGHWHTWRDDGVRDGIHHYVVAGTGAGLGPLQSSAQVQEICQVRVRPDGVSLAVMPVGQVHGGDMVLGAEVDVMNGLLQGGWVATEGAALLPREGTAESTFQVALHNPTDRRAGWRLDFEEPDGWSFQVERKSGVLEPDARHRATVLVTAPAFQGQRPDVGVLAAFDYSLQSGLVQPITRRVPVPVGIEDAERLAASQAGPNRALKFDGRSCVRVPLRHAFEALTLECWVRGHPPRGWAGLVSKTQQSGFSLNWADPQPDGNVRIAGHRDYVNVKTAEPWQWDEWTHLAFTWDGKVARIWRNGRLDGEKPAEGPLHDNGLPLFVGADTNGRGNPEHHFVGEIDEVRVSDTCRYTRRFKPKKRHRADEHTVILFHFDREIGGVFLDGSGRHNHGWPLGNVEQVTARY